MSVKAELRKQLKAERKAVANKAETDRKISDNLLSFELYKKAKTVLFYAPLDDEINIDSCIEQALFDGKKVALPVCTDKYGNMKFYCINSFFDIKTGFFGVREPDTDICREIEDFSSSICIVPAIAYDKKGFRLGYGRGYYDRFLKNYTSHSVGLCYNKLIKDELPIGEYDIPVDYIICENGIITV